MNYDDLPLGKQTNFVSEYSPQILFPISRQSNREQLGIGLGELPFFGVDIWTGFELSWLNNRGLPQVACGQFFVPANSPAIIESKSFKLYLNSLNQSRFASWHEVAEVLERDLSLAAGAPVAVQLHGRDQWQHGEQQPAGSVCLDDLDVDITDYHPNSLLLRTSGPDCSEILCSHLLRSLCPVTGQPDWGSVYVQYSGPEIDRAGLLRYIVSYRLHQDFHEHCVERMFVDVIERCKPASLTVYARYLRRGGLDINPYRSTDKQDFHSHRHFRQ